MRLAKPSPAARSFRPNRQTNAATSSSTSQNLRTSGRGAMEILQCRPGDLVRVRRQRWRVVDVQAHDGCQVVTLTGADPRTAGLERSVIAPFDAIEPVRRPPAPRVANPRRRPRTCT